MEKKKQTKERQRKQGAEFIIVILFKFKVQKEISLMEWDV